MLLTPMVIRPVRRAARLALGRTATFSIVLTVGCMSASQHVATTSSSLAKYVEEATALLARCELAARSHVPSGPQSEDLGWRDVCLTAPSALGPLYRDAEREVHMQRGTLMYLRMYQDQWNAIIELLLARNAANQSEPAAAASARERLAEIARKLVP